MSFELRERTRIPRGRRLAQSAGQAGAALTFGMEFASNLVRDKAMAYIDRDEQFLLWLLAALGNDVPTDSQIHLLGRPAEPEGEAIDPEAPRGYIIRDWFGPFLLGPARRYQRGRC